MRNLLVKLAVLVFVATPIALAQSGSRLAERFRELDRDNDGKISEKEFPGALFRQIDRDRDGFVTSEEAADFFAGRRQTQSEKPAAAAPELADGGKLQVVDAEFELCVRDVEACAKFYRDGIGMREVEPAGAEKGALLEWAGCYLRLRKVPGEKAPPATGNPIRQMSADNGFRWFSLWFNDPAAVAERLVEAGYPAPVKGGNVSMTRDPDGNIVELMGVPRTASGETFTWGMAVSDASAARKFYGDTLGLREFDPWSLPIAGGLKMYLFATGAGRVKFSAPPGERPETPAASPPGQATVRRGAMAANAALIFRRLDRNNDGRLSAEELPRRELLVRADRNGDGSVSLAEVRAYLGRQGGAAVQRVLDAPPTPFLPPAAPGEPPLKPLPDSDASRDAAGRGQLFESIHVANLTDFRAGMNGLAVVDLNRDGLLDIVATYSPPRGAGGRWGKGEMLRVLINEGGFKFRTHELELRDCKFTMDDFGRGQVPGLVDFNNDGFLDLFVTRHARMSGGKPSVPGAESPGNSLFVTEGAWDVFRDVSEQMGVRNEQAYNRQPCFGDVNRDGWLDIAIGCDNIKAAWGGFPHSRLYVFKPNGNQFDNGRYQDIGGTDLVPDFGGFYGDAAKDKAGPDVNLRDLDGDGDLDLVQSCHVDVREPLLPYWPGEYRQGVFCWKNLLAETGKLQFEKITGNGLACEARLRYDREEQIYVPEGKAPGLPYLTTADVGNHGQMDVLAVGPASPGWAPRAEYVGGRFWHNLGGFQFQQQTRAAGLESLEWTFREWTSFFDQPVDEAAFRARPGKLQSQPGMDRPDPLEGRPYFADAAFADFDNDGWIDLVVQDRHEGLRIPARAILYMNKGDGTFELKPTTFSGLDANGICFETADLNDDGLIDLICPADPDNSGIAMTADRYETKVYWNTGEHGGRENRWLRLRFGGATHAELIGARVEVRKPKSGKLLGARWIHTNPSYKSGGPLEAHFGLGRQRLVDVVVTLLDGRRTVLEAAAADQFAEVDLQRKSIEPVARP